MANRKGRPVDIIEPKVFRTVDEVNQAITKLGRRLDEIRALDPARTRHGDSRVASAAQNFRETVLSIYGQNSPEYREHGHDHIWNGSMHLNMSEREVHEGFVRGIAHTIEALENLIRRLNERKADFAADKGAQVRAAFDGLDLHPRIAVCADLYRDGHYRNAVLEASIALVNLVKEKSRRHDLDGAGLMTTVFSKNKPVLAFNDLKDQTDLDEQEGIMHLFAGSVLALRNPRAHALLDDSAEQALEYIALISLLAKRVDQAKRTAP